MPDSFVKRKIEVAIALASNTQTNQPNSFAGTDGKDTVTLSGSRTEVRIENSGAPAGSQANVSVYGMTPSLMNQLATLGMIFNIVPKNTITITAGDDVNGMSPVFSGTIVAGYGDYNSAPNVPFKFEANTLLAENIAPSPVSSFKGPIDVATVMAGFARQMNLGFENNGVSIKLPPSYFSGTVVTQMRACADHAGINAEVVNGNVLAIWPKGGNRNTPSIPLIAPGKGLVGYPAYTQQGIILKAVFNPLISFGGLIQVQSSLKQVAEVGTWAVNKLDLALDSQVPHGQWMSIINAYNPRYPKPLPQ